MSELTSDDDEVKKLLIWPMQVCNYLILNSCALLFGLKRKCVILCGFKATCRLQSQTNGHAVCSFRWSLTHCCWNMASMPILGMSLTLYLHGVFQLH